MAKKEQRGVPKLDTDRVVMNIRISITQPFNGREIVKDESIDIEFSDEINSGPLYYWLKHYHGKRMA